MMRTRSLLGPALVAAAALLGACGGQTSGTVGLGISPPTPPSTTGATTLPTPTTTIPPTPTEDLTGFGTAPFRSEHVLAVPPVPVLTAVRTAGHGSFDRTVFDFDGRLPAAVSVRYVDRVVSDGSGQPVSVAGGAFLLVRFEEAQAHNDTGAATVPRRAQPSLASIREVVLAGDYEGYVTLALGLESRTPFRVLELSNPSRVVVDVLTGGR